jgi:hypothetical protein
VGDSEQAIGCVARAETMYSAGMQTPPRAFDDCGWKINAIEELIFTPKLFPPNPICEAQRRD